MIDRIRLSAAAKIQLATLKRRTGIEHNNALCRHALCLSLANPAFVPAETLNFSNGLEIDWRIFTGNNEAVYYNLVVVRMLNDNMRITDNTVKDVATLHTHRGLSLLVGQKDTELFA